MKTELPPDVFFRPDLRLMIFRPHGVLDEKAVDQVVTFLEKEEEQADQCFNRFVDLSKLDSIQLSFDYLVRVSLHRRLSSMKRPRVKSAFFVTSEQAAHVADTHALLTDHSPLQVEVFHEVAAAARWLGVSPENLRIPE